MQIFIKGLLKRKELKYYILIFAFFFVLFLVLVNTYMHINDDINLKEEYYTNRELRVITSDTFDIAAEKIYSINYVDRVYTNNYISGFLSDDVVNIQTFIFEKNIKLLKGRSIQNEREIILSKKYELYYDTEVNIKVDDDDYKMTVVGIFDDEKIADTAFVLNNMTIKSNDVIIGYNVLVNKTKNVDSVINSLMKMDYSANIFNNLNSVYDLILIRYLLSIFGFILIIAITVFDFLLFKNIILDNMKEISILKSVGYSVNKILLINLNKNLFILLLSFLTSLVIGIAIYNVTNISFYPISLIYLIIIIIITFSINVLILKRLLVKANSILLYKNTI